MKSKFNGFCKACHQTIRAGEEIRKYPAGFWGHAVCPKEGEVRPPVVAGQPKVAFEDFPLSPFQMKIVDFIRNEDGNLVIIAVAGSGKTWMLLKILYILPPDGDTIMVAFNKPIAVELQQKAPDHVTVKTLHALGYANLRAAFGRVEVDERKLDKILNDNAFLPWPEKQAPEKVKAEWRSKRAAMHHLVALSKATLVDVNNPLALQSMIDHYGIDLNDGEEELRAMLPAVLEACKAQTNVTDFDDMLWLPIVLHLPLKQYKRVLIDEVQDLNDNQIEFVLRTVKPGGRVIAVGDPRQSLYGFRGADIEAVERVTAALHATRLPLSVTYRCPKSHVTIAKEIVPEIEARDGAPEGNIENLTEIQFRKHVKPNDMVICRTNAPLVSAAFDLIRDGVKAVVRGRDIGAMFAVLARKLEAPTLEEMERNIRDYRDKELQKLLRRNSPESQIESLNDKIDTLLTVLDQCDKPKEVGDKLEALFSDDVEGVVLSSVHRAKGLQAKRVFILRPELMPLPHVKQEWEKVQEANCQYVAYTRATSDLFFVR